MPEPYKYLEDVVDEYERHEPKVEDALDIYLMSLAWLGAPAWSDEHLGKCLAWGWMSGFNEACVLSGMSIPLILASYRFAVRGGCLVQWELFRQYVSPFVRDLWWNGNKVSWLAPIMTRYAITGWEKINYKEWCSPDMIEKAIVRLDITARPRTRAELEREVPINCRFRPAPAT